MNSNDATAKIQQMESHIQRLRATQEDNKRAAGSLKHDANSLKSEMAQTTAQVTRATADNDDARRAALQLERRFREQKHDKEEAAKQHKKEAELIDRRIAEASDILMHLKTMENTLRDYESQARTWADQADKLMS